ncbi:hypothetical protein ACLOJK_019107 [Asimina triloba]
MAKRHHVQIHPSRPNHNEQRCIVRSTMGPSGSLGTARSDRSSLPWCSINRQRPSSLVRPRLSGAWPTLARLDGIRSVRNGQRPTSISDSDAADG